MISPERTSAEWWDELVDDYVDGILSEDERTRIESALETDSVLASQIELSKSIHEEFHSMSGLACPDWVTAGVMREVRADFVHNAWRRGWQAIKGFSIRQLRPVMATALLVGAIVLSSRIGVPETASDAAVAQALDDVKWTLAYLSDVTRQTGTAVRAEALEPLVLNSMQHAVDAFIDN